MQIDPRIIGLISATLRPSADLAEGDVKLGIGKIDHNPETLGLLATAQLDIPSSGSIEFDFKKFALIGTSGSDAEGRTIAFNEIRCLAIYSTLPLNVSAGSADWAASPLPDSLQAFALTGSLLVFSDSKSAVLANPSETETATLTILAIGSNTTPGSLTFNGIPFTFNGNPFTA